MELTFNWFAIPRSSYLVDNVGNGPVLIAHLHMAHGDFGRMPRRLEHISASSGDGLLLSCADNERLCGDRREAIDLGTKVQFDNVVLLQRLRRRRVRTDEVKYI